MNEDPRNEDPRNEEPTNEMVDIDITDMFPIFNNNSKNGFTMDRRVPVETMKLEIFEIFDAQDLDASESVRVLCNGIFSVGTNRLFHCREAIEILKNLINETIEKEKQNDK